MECLVGVDDGARLWVADAGTHDGPPVVFCHGGPGVADYLEPVAAMIDDVARVIRWDQRGSGRSSLSGPYSVARCVQDLEMLRAHFEIAKWVLVGHSWGANLAVHYAQLHPDRVAGVVYLCGTGIEWWPKFSAEHKANQRARLGPILGERLDALRSKQRTVEEDDEYDLLYLRSEMSDPARAGELARLVHEQDHQFPISAEANAGINADNKAISLEEQRQRCRRITAAVVLVDCADDPRPSSAVDTLEAALPNVTRYHIARAGHFPWLEQPGELRQLLRDFVLRASAAGHACGNALEPRTNDGV